MRDWLSICTEIPLVWNPPIQLGTPFDQGMECRRPMLRSYIEIDFFCYIRQSIAEGNEAFLMRRKRK